MKKPPVAISCPKNIDRGTYIRCLLVARRITEASIGRELGLTKGHINKVLYGRKSRLVRQKIADAVGIPYEELWGDDA
jgi:lambda repressor-like predicted transcriptional regulator